MVRITGAKEHAARVKRIAGPEMVREIGAALFASGDAIKVDAQISITNGAVSGKGHTVSKPGQPPNNDTGQLANNIENVQVESLKVEVSSNAPYAAALEYGTSKMAARPYMAPAVAKNRKEISNNIAIAVKRAVGGARSSSAARAVSKSEGEFFGGVKGR